MSCTRGSCLLRVQLVTWRLLGWRRWWVMSRMRQLLGLLLQGVLGLAGG
jgi:hypothetical protein